MPHHPRDGSFGWKEPYILLLYEVTILLYCTYCRRTVFTYLSLVLFASLACAMNENCERWPKVLNFRDDYVIMLSGSVLFFTSAHSSVPSSLVRKPSRVYRNACPEAWWHLMVSPCLPIPVVLLRDETSYGYSSLTTHSPRAQKTSGFFRCLPSDLLLYPNVIDSDSSSRFLVDLVVETEAIVFGQ